MDRREGEDKAPQKYTFCLASSFPQHLLLVLIDTKCLLLFAGEEAALSPTCLPHNQALSSH